MQFKKAFTMAEAILVMTILGIIATIMITTLKPAEFKDKGLAVLADKVLSEIDTATTQILINNSMNGKMNQLVYSGAAIDSNAAAHSNNVGVLYKKYLTSTRKACSSSTCPCNAMTNKFYLKDGACMGITMGNQASVATIFPGESATTSNTASYGVLFFDTNGEDEPNTAGRDQFRLPFNVDGIQYSN